MEALLTGGAPSAWRFPLRRLKLVCSTAASNVDKHSRDTEVPVRLANYTDVYNNAAVTPEMDLMHATASTAQVNRLSLIAGDTLITKDSETADDIAVPAFVPFAMPGVVCGYHLTIVRPGPLMHPRFVYWLFSATPMRAQFEVAAKGLTRVGLSAEAIENVLLPVPSLDEQRRIAAFLDHETARIDELVEEQEHLKGLLAERRHATTVAAVNGELLGKPLEPSAVPWLQRHAVVWRPVRVRFVARLGSGHTPSRSHPEYWQDCTIPWITTGEVSQIRHDRVQYLTETRERVSELGVQNSAAAVHPAGTVVLSRTASAGFSAIMGLDMATSQDFVTWTCGPRLRPRFLLLCLRAMRPDLLGRLAMGSTHKTIYFPDVESLTIPLPPVDEQDEAVEQAWSRLHRIDETVDSLDAGVRLLRERRSALITAAVTGQIDVSTWTPPDDWLSPEAA